MDPGEFRAFVLGGVFWTRGDHIPYTARGFENIFLPEFPIEAVIEADTEGFCVIPCITQTFVDAPGPGDTSLKPNRGWDVAAGFDYRLPGTPWHVNGQARGGQAKGSDAIGSSFSQNTTGSIVFPGNLIFFSQSGALASQGTSVTTAALTERHWQADVGMGYDFFPRFMQVKLRFPCCRSDRDHYRYNRCLSNPVRCEPNPRVFCRYPTKIHVILRTSLLSSFREAGLRRLRTSPRTDAHSLERVRALAPRARCQFGAR